MNYYTKVSDAAKADFREYIHFIIAECSNTIDAAKHYAGIQNAIKELCKNPYANAVRYEKSLQRYGEDVRRVNYKKMAIIYTINDAIVNVHRIIPASMITDN